MRHRLHALCPYFAMFPEAFVERWVSLLTRPKDIVLDPFCGRGTSPFQSLLMGRRAVASDINPVAYCITRAKTNPPAASSLRRRLTLLEDAFEADEWEAPRQALPSFFKVAYSRATMRQILYLRNSLQWKENDTDCMLAALVLGSLHGESEYSPSFLSNQMPHTISTKPDYSVQFWKARGFTAPKRDAFDLLRKRIAYRYESELPKLRATVLQSDFRELTRRGDELPGPMRFAITSPPYLDVTSYEEDQWLRIWFLGGASAPTYRQISKDDRIERPDVYWGVIGDMWRVLGQLLDSKANVVIRFGAKKLTARQMVDMLEGCAAFSGRKVRLASWESSPIKRRQTDTFRPGSKGCLFEVDLHFKMA